jgi:hypothetical protein
MCSAINGRITRRDDLHFVTITPSAITANAINPRIVTTDRNIIAEALSEYRNHIRAGLIDFNLVWTLDDMMTGQTMAQCATVHARFQTFYASTTPRTHGRTVDPVDPIE